MTGESIVNMFYFSGTLRQIQVCHGDSRNNAAILVGNST